MKKYFFILISILLLTVSCTGKQGKEDAPTLTVTIEPLRYFTEAIAGDKFQVVSIVPKGANPEIYDPTPQQLVELARSKAYLRIGHIGFEQAWAERLQANTPKLPFYDMSQGVDLIHEIHPHAHTHGNIDGVEPHIWNSVSNARIISSNICKALSEIDPDNQTYYQTRLDSLQQVINRTEREMQSYLTNADYCFLIYHPALSYFARDYSLQQISIEEGGKEPSPSHLQELMKTCKQKQVRVVFVQQEFDQRNAEVIAQELGLKIVPIHPLSYDWNKEMIHIAKSLSKKQ